MEMREQLRAVSCELRVDYQGWEIIVFLSIIKLLEIKSFKSFNPLAARSSELEANLNQLSLCITFLSCFNDSNYIEALFGGDCWRFLQTKRTINAIIIVSIVASLRFDIFPYLFSIFFYVQKSFL